jgi:hypothetical protein
MERRALALTFLLPGEDRRTIDLNIQPNHVSRARICQRFRSPRIDSASLCILAGRYDNPLPTRFLAPIECLKIPARVWVRSCRVAKSSHCHGKCKCKCCNKCRVQSQHLSTQWNLRGADEAVNKVLQESF